MKFKSKIDWWSHIFLASIPIMNLWMLIYFILYDTIVVVPILVVILSLINIFLILPIWINTSYIFEENELLVKCGFGKGTRVAYNSIKKIKETRSLLASPALSRDRIEIFYGAIDMVIVSPKEKVEFLEQLEIRRTNANLPNLPKEMVKTPG